MRGGHGFIIRSGHGRSLCDSYVQAVDACTATPDPSHSGRTWTAGTVDEVSFDATTEPTWGAPEPGQPHWSRRQTVLAVGVAAVIAALGGAAIYAATYGGAPSGGPPHGMPGGRLPAGPPGMCPQQN